MQVTNSGCDPLQDFFVEVDPLFHREISEMLGGASRVSHN